MFIGYLTKVKGFKFWNFNKPKCIISEDASFRKGGIFIKEEDRVTTSKVVIEVELHGKDR